MTTEKRATSYRLSEATMRRIERLSVKLEISKAATIERAIRELAEREGVDKGER